jgi:hypothetical protein
MIFSYRDEIQNTQGVSNLQITQNNNPYYSKDLIEIIFSMIKANQRPNANQLYNNVKKKYVKKYARNTSIEAVLRCLISYKNLNKIMEKYNKKFTQDTKKYYFNYWFYEAYKSIVVPDEAKTLAECLEEFRKAIASFNSKLDGNKEIDPLYLIAFLLQKMHIETNEKKYSNNINGQNSMGNYVINSAFNG